MRGDLSHIIGAIHNARAWRSQSQPTYRRLSNGRFVPSTITLPTWLWHELVTAGEEYSKFADHDLTDDCDEGGTIDQHMRAFRVAIVSVDGNEHVYSHDGQSFIPQHLTIPTEFWHEINLLIDFDDDDRQIDHPDDEL